MISMAQRRRSSGQRRGKQFVEVRTSEKGRTARKKAIRDQWLDPNYRRATDPVRLLLARALVMNHAEARNLQRAAKKLLEARRKAELWVKNLRKLGDEFLQQLYIVKRTARWAMDERAQIPYTEVANVLQMNPDYLRRAMFEGLDENLCAFVTGVAGNRCPICKRTR